MNMTHSFALVMKRLLFLLLLPLPLFAQTGAVTGTALDNVGNVVAGATISVCPQGSPGIPCSPVTASTISNGQGAFSVTVPVGTYTVTVFRLGIVATSSTIVVAPSNITIANNVTYAGAVVFSGNVTFTNQITSTLATGTAPFSIASTTVVPNLNAQLHNGLTAPASAIVGINDTQTLTAKTLTAPTLTSPALTTPTIGGTTITNVPVMQCSATAFILTSIGNVGVCQVDSAITVTRVQFQVPVGGVVGATCATSPVIQVGAAAGTNLTLFNSSSGGSTGAISVNLAAGNIAIAILTASSGCGTNWSNVYLSFEYRMQ